MNLKESVEFLEEYRSITPRGPILDAALETVLAAIRRANLTDEEIDPFSNAAVELWERKGENMNMEKTWITLGQRRVRDLLHGEGKG